jgi:hypothetical protein
MSKIPINNKHGGFWWLFDDDTPDENIPIQTSLSSENLDNQTLVVEPNNTLQSQTPVEESPWWKFWDDDSESDSESEEDPKSESVDSEIFVTSVSAPTGEEEKGFWESIFGDSSSSEDNDEKEVKKEKGFWESIFGDSSSEDNDEKEVKKEKKLKKVKNLITEKNIKESVKEPEKLKKVKNSISEKNIKEPVKEPEVVDEHVKVDVDINSYNIVNSKKSVKDQVKVDVDINSYNVMKEKEVKEIPKENITIPQIETTNKKLMIFISNLCNHKLNDSVISNVYNLINSNKKLFEEEPVRLSILKYRLCNHISNYEKIENLFFDIGFNDNVYETDLNNFKLDYIIDIGKSKNVLQKREVIIFDEEHDTNLRDMIKKVNNFEKNDKLYKNIISVIINYMSEECDDFKFNKFMAATAFKYKTNLIYIGDIDCGLDRHKSLLFKYLCDNVGLQCSLLRNNKMDLNGNIYDDHVWNLILLNGKVYIVDFRYFPNRIVHPNNSETSKYYNIRKLIA